LGQKSRGGRRRGCPQNLYASSQATGMFTYGPPPPDPACWYPIRVVTRNAATGFVGPIVWVLPSDSASVSVVRRRLNALLTTTPRPRLDDVILAASELVTNAILHGNGPVVVSVRTGPPLRVEIADSGEGTAQRLTGLGHEDEAGRGLFIVDVVTTRWGVLPTMPGPGKTVWFEMD